MGKERIGSEIVNVWGDRTNERGLATAGYDDDGVKTTKFPIVEKGVFKHYQTIRDQARLVGERNPATSMNVKRVAIVKSTLPLCEPSTSNPVCTIGGA